MLRLDADPTGQIFGRLYDYLPPHQLAKLRFQVLRGELELYAL